MEKGSWRFTLDGEYWDEADKVVLKEKIREFVAELSGYYIAENLEFIPENKSKIVMHHPV